ncbi:MAG: M20/M25/M40 family metallo-hydrolase [Gemmatimonadetes bacterium]|nr:M20/M25/M40 family metallo-hydrolase [Gemmatimonadota bacterium]
MRAYLEHNEATVLRELRDLLAIPNLGSDLPNIRRNAETLVRMLERRGAKARILETGGAPLVYGEIGDPSLPTILFYCHYDGQPVNPSQWAQPNPWNPILRTGALESGGREVSRWPARGEPVPPEWRVYARSASDDKAPIIALLHILDAWRASGIEPPNRLKFLFEGDEEAGSKFLPQIAGEHRDLLLADLAIMADGPIHPSGRPTAVFGLRGIVTVTVTVYGPIRPLHSGHYGNWAPNPAMRLAQLLASMKGPNGEVLIEGWEEDVIPLGAAERAALARYPQDDDAQRLQFQLGSLDGGGAKRMELITQPSLNVRGLQALFTGAEARTLIPDVAVAELDLRLVAGNTPERQLEKLVRHIERQGYQVVREDPDSAFRVNAPRLARVEVRDGYPAGRTSLEHPAATALVTALSAAGLGKPVVIPTMGGSGPAYVFTDIPKMPFAALPVVNHDNNQHAENENLRLGNLFQGMEILAAAAAARLRD